MHHSTLITEASVFSRCWLTQRLTTGQGAENKKTAECPVGHLYHKAQGSGITAREEPEDRESQRRWWLQGQCSPDPEHSCSYELTVYETACTKPVQIYIRQNPNTERGGEHEVWQLIAAGRWKTSFLQGRNLSMFNILQWMATYRRACKQHKLSWRDNFFNYMDKDNFFNYVNKEGGWIWEELWSCGSRSVHLIIDYDQMDWTRFSKK